MKTILFLLLFIFCSVTISGSVIDSNGFETHLLESPYQADKTTLRVLLPDDLEAGKRYRVLYVLPVHEDGEHRHGEGLVEIKKLGYHNSHGLICVAPSFTSEPWFADNDLNPKMHDESHMLKTVLPFVEELYPVQTNVEGRLLIGFSKSGWGSLSLVLRNPDVFFKAAAWDTGIRVDMGPIEESDRAERIEKIWGTVKNFNTYRISNLIRTRGSDLGDKARLFYFSTEGRRAVGGVRIHQLLVEHEIPHRYVFEPNRVHRWDTGWIPDAVAFLVKE
jgi:S-formylglutathione hydrolase FrmB